MDIMESMYIAHHLYQIFNLTQLKLKRRPRSLVQCRTLECYSVCVLLISIYVMFHSLFVEEDLIKIKKYEFGQILTLIQLTGKRLTHIITVLETILRRNEQQQFFEKVREIDRIFECSLKLPVDNRSFCRKMLKYAIIMFTIYTTPQLLKLWNILHSGSVKHYSVLWTLYLMPYAVCSLHYFQIFTAISIIKQRLERLTDTLEEAYLNENCKITTPPTVFETTERMNRSSDMENSEVKKLVIVRDLYNRLWDLTALMNRCVGVSVLINVTNDFTSIASNLYWIFLIFKRSSSTFFVFRMIAHTIFWSIPYMCNVLVLAILCDRAAQSTKTVALCLQRIHRKNYNHNTVIKQFSLQLLHQKIIFTAAGFFNVDCTLMYTIVGAAATYLVIILQFHMNELFTNP